MTAVPAFAQSMRERTLRTLQLIDELDLDEGTAAKLLPALTAYDKLTAGLDAQQDELAAKLRGTDDPTLGDQLLDEQLENERLMLGAEATLVTRLRRLLPAAQAARARVLLFGPGPGEQPSQPRRSHRDDLFPPGSRFGVRVPCDPFESMHGC